jgi:translation initiation factor 1
MTKKPDSPFAALAHLREQLPPGAASKVGSAAAPAPKLMKAPARAVVRLERKHRGGKEVTVIDKLALSPDELARWCRELKQALGCGGAVDGASIVLQGDLRQRAGELLSARGVAKVTMG